MKTLRYFFVAALAMVVGNAFAADVTDELTWQALGLDGTTNQYKDYSGIKLTSTAVYAGQMSSGGGRHLRVCGRALSLENFPGDIIELNPPKACGYRRLYKIIPSKGIPVLYGKCQFHAFYLPPQPSVYRILFRALR